MRVGYVWGGVCVGVRVGVGWVGLGLGSGCGVFVWVWVRVCVRAWRGADGFRHRGLPKSLSCRHGRQTLGQQ